MAPESGPASGDNQVSELAGGHDRIRLLIRARSDERFATAGPVAAGCCSRVERPSDPEADVWWGRGSA